MLVSHLYGKYAPVKNLVIWAPAVPLLGKKLLWFFESWGRNPVFQFLLGTFAKVGWILGRLEPSDEIDRVSTSDNSTPSGAN